jgi:hypothetical protein
LKIWLFAGTSGVSGGTRRVREARVSDNPSGAENQQERLDAGASRILRGHTPDILVGRMKIWSQLHGDMQEPQ